MAGLRKLRGKYYARVRLNGKREKLVPLNTTEQRVAEKRLKFLNEREWFLKIGWEKELSLDPPPTLSEAITTFLREARNKGLAVQTVTHYKYGLNHLRRVLSGSHRISEITEDRCKDFVTLLSKELAFPSVNSYIKVLNTFINWLRGKYKIDMPPKIKEIRVEEQLPEFLTPDELDRIYDLCYDPKMLSTFKVYEHTGIRLRELSNCILEETTSGVWVKLRKTKGKRERIIPIPPEIKEDFKAAKFAPYKHNPKKCEPYKGDHISKTFTRLRDKAGIAKNKSVHSLRHTFALRKLLEWGNIYLVMQALGHADVKTTQVYLKFPEGFLKDVFSDWIPDIKANLQHLAEKGANA